VCLSRGLFFCWVVCLILNFPISSEVVPRKIWRVGKCLSLVLGDANEVMPLRMGHTADVDYKVVDKLCL
jgi:hypothetical protein